MGDTTDFVVPHDLDPSGAMAAQSDLLEAIDKSNATDFSLDIAKANATQVSLQILIAGLIELRERGVSFHAGPIAKTLLKRSALEDH